MKDAEDEEISSFDPNEQTISFIEIKVLVIKLINEMINQ